MTLLSLCCRKNSRLHIPSARVQDSGNYMCVVENDSGSSNSTSTVQVQSSKLQANAYNSMINCIIFHQLIECCRVPKGNVFHLVLHSLCIPNPAADIIRLYFNTLYCTPKLCFAKETVLLFQTFSIWVGFKRFFFSLLNFVWQQIWKHLFPKSFAWQMPHHQSFSNMPRHWSPCTIQLTASL